MRKKSFGAAQVDDILFVATMNLIVLPLTWVPPSAIGALAAIHGVVGHALFVGLAAAIVTRKVHGRREEAT